MKNRPFWLNFQAKTTSRHRLINKSAQVDLLLLNALLFGSTILNQLINVIGDIVDTATVQLLGHVLFGSAESIAEIAERFSVENFVVQVWEKEKTTKSSN